MASAYGGRQEPALSRALFSEALYRAPPSDGPVAAVGINQVRMWKLRHGGATRQADLKN
jgi:hypothetical protein